MTLAEYYNFSLSEKQRATLVAQHNGLAYGQTKSWHLLNDKAKNAVDAAYQKDNEVMIEPEVSIAKAKLYKTARVHGNSDCFQCGTIVAVEYVGRGAFGLNFRCTLHEFTEVLSEHALTDFVL
jgi:hypothetical protein